MEKQRLWLSLVGVSTIMIGTVFVIAQQGARIGLNSGLYGVADNTRQQLANNIAPSAIVPEYQIDLASDDTQFVIMADDTEKILASSAQLNGSSILPPPGVLDYTKQHGIDRVTWQPQKGVRLAIVVKNFTAPGVHGYVIVGQSLRQTENLIELYIKLSILGWLAIMATISVIIFDVRKIKHFRFRTNQDNRFSVSKLKDLEPIGEDQEITK